MQLRLPFMVRKLPMVSLLSPQKRAKEGDVKVSFDMSLTAQTFAGGVDMLDAYQWGDVYWQAYIKTLTELIRTV